MASTYNSLGYQLMATGENAGTWGTKTNTTLNEIKQTFGYISLDMAAADRTLTIPDRSISLILLLILFIKLRLISLL